MAAASAYSLAEGHVAQGVDKNGVWRLHQILQPQNEALPRPVLRAAAYPRVSLPIHIL